MTTPDDDFLISMGLQSCWVTPDTAEALIEEGLAEYGLFQDEETRTIEDGLALCAGITPDDVWAFIRENDPETADEA